jgi:hypothetical protein
MDRGEVGQKPCQYSKLDMSLGGWFDRRGEIDEKSLNPH